MATSYDSLFPSYNVMSGLQPQDPSQGLQPLSTYGGGQPDTGLGGAISPAQQGNFLQQLSAGTGQMTPNDVAPQAPGITQLPQQMPDQPAPGGNTPRKRLSAIDVLGRISDVIAKTGGAEQQYQPYLDQRIATQQQQQGNNLDMDAKRADIAQTGTATQGAQNGILGNYARAVKNAIQGGVDPHQAMAGFAQQLGIPPNVAAIFGHQYDQNPASLDALASVGDPNERETFGTTPVWTTDANGNQVLAQISNRGNFKRVDMGELTPTDTIQANNAGDRLIYTARHGNGAPVRSQTIQGHLGTDTQARVDANGNVVGAQILPGSATAANLGNATQRTLNDTNRTNNAINPKVDTAASQHALSLLDNIQSGFKDLHGMNALPGEGSISAAIGRTGIGQTIGEQTGNAAAQKRLEIGKNLSALQQAMIKSIPASATRTKFEQEIIQRGLPDPTKMSYATAQTVIQQLRDSYKDALNDSATRPSPLPGARPTLAAPPAAVRGVSKPQVIGW